MKNSLVRFLLILNFVVFLGYYSWSVYGKETTLRDGQLILFQLAPVDPRSLMQGDYMRLNYAITDNLHDNVIAKRGYCKVSLGENNVAKEIISISETMTGNDHEGFWIKYFQNGFWVSLGADSYFFQEGSAEKYENAKFGGLKVDASGNSILVGLFDENLNEIR